MKMASIKNRLKVISILLLLSIGLSFIWLGYTESGLRWLYQRVQHRLPAEINIDKLEGQLLGSITLTGIRYQQDGRKITSEQLTLQWQPVSLLAGDIVINSLHLQSLNVVWPEVEKSDQPFNLADIQLPFNLVLHDVELNNISITQARHHFEITQIKLDANSDANSLQIDTLQLITQEGEITTRGQLSLSPQLSWDAEFTASNFNPGIFWPEWGGQLNATLISRGTTENDELTANAEISSLTGQLRGYPVSLQSQLDWHHSGLDIRQFELNSGSSHISAQGRAGETLKLDWVIASNNLAELYPEAQGRLQASGELKGTQATPIINATFSANKLSLPSYKIGSMTGKLELDLFSWQQINIELFTKDLSFNNYVLSSLAINADTHHLTANANANGTAVQIELKGDADKQGWRGHIKKANIQSRQFSEWQLTSPVALSITGDSLLMDQLCLQQQQSKLCVVLQRTLSQWQAKFKIQQIPLMLFSQWLPPDIKFEGNADGTAELQFLSPDQLQAKSHIELTSGTLIYHLLEGEVERKEYRSGMLNLTLDDNGLDVSANITMSNSDLFQGKLLLPGANLLALDYHRQPLKAEGKLTLNDLGIIEALIPEVNDIKGNANLTISANGTFAKPDYIIQANLLNGRFQIPRLGLSISQINVEGKSDGKEQFTFKLNAHSGDGKLAVLGETRLNSTDGWPTTMAIKGDSFQVSQIAEAQVVISPDLQIKIQRRNIEINGDINIPYAKLQPKDITTAARVSNDVVIVGDQKITEERWKIYTKVRLTLGERVSFYGFGFEGNLGGSLLVDDKPEDITRAVGEINVKQGRYSAYGQNLAVEHGRLLFTGGPLTNPGLDMRAVRHINEITAGLKVRGSLNQPQVELFSIPAMGQTDAFSYLLLGRPLQTASGDEGNMMAKAALALSLSEGDHLARTLADRFGLDEMRVESSDTGDQASLVMGRYLSPRLYISYGVGLIEAFNTFSVRYQISDKWILKGESAEHQGADFLYTIER